jgi:hypothetical protein
LLRSVFFYFFANFWKFARQTRKFWICWIHFVASFPYFASLFFRLFIQRKASPRLLENSPIVTPIVSGITRTRAKVNKVLLSPWFPCRPEKMALPQVKREWKYFHSRFDWWTYWQFKSDSARVNDYTASLLHWNYILFSPSLVFFVYCNKRHIISWGQYWRWPG